jgi:hypothetical protein
MKLAGTSAVLAYSGRDKRVASGPRQGEEKLHGKGGGGQEANQRVICLGFARLTRMTNRSSLLGQHGLCRPPSRQGILYEADRCAPRIIP